MFEVLLNSEALPRSNKPIRVSARQAHWLQIALEQYLEVVGEDLGCEFEIDSAKLQRCFIDWLRTVTSQKPNAYSRRQEYFGFSAGVMLRELLKNGPVVARGKPSKADAESPAHFWPEGLACTMFCLAVHEAVQAEEFKAPRKKSAEVNDLRFWWSFKENARKNPDLAVPFFESLIGIEPSWMLPGIFPQSRTVSHS
jgi:hypothetical protein